MKKYSVCVSVSCNLFVCLPMTDGLSASRKQQPNIYTDMSCNWLVLNAPASQEHVCLVATPHLGQPMSQKKHLYTKTSYSFAHPRNELHATTGDDVLPSSISSNLATALSIQNFVENESYCHIKRGKTNVLPLTKSACALLSIQ